MEMLVWDSRSLEALIQPSIIGLKSKERSYPIQGVLLDVMGKHTALNEKGRLRAYFDRLGSWELPTNLLAPWETSMVLHAELWSSCY